MKKLIRTVTQPCAICVAQMVTAREIPYSTIATGLFWLKNDFPVFSAMIWLKPSSSFFFPANARLLPTQAWPTPFARDLQMYEILFIVSSRNHIITQKYPDKFSMESSVFNFDDGMWPFHHLIGVGNQKNIPPIMLYTPSKKFNISLDFNILEKIKIWGEKNKKIGGGILLLKKLEIYNFQ